MIMPIRTLALLIVAVGAAGCIAVGPNRPGGALPDGIRTGSGGTPATGTYPWTEQGDGTSRGYPKPTTVSGSPESWATKVVAYKSPPTELTAEDQSRCTVDAKTFEQVQPGDRKSCAWRSVASRIWSAVH